MKAVPLLEPDGRLIINALRKENRDREILVEIDSPRNLWLEKAI